MEQIIIKNIQDYVWEIINDELVLTPKKKYLTEDEIEAEDFAYSKIVDCSVKDNDTMISKKKQYQKVMKEIWQYMPHEKLIELTTYNIKETCENGNLGYNWFEPCNISFQSKDSNGSLFEIIHMCKENNYTLNLSIELKSKKIVYIRI